jgi:nucleotide-binding universal stress UspA family protein
MVICRHFPDGGGVYSAAKSQGQTLAVIGALLLIADLTVTASLSGWEALKYLDIFKVLPPWIMPYATIGTIVLMGWLNSYGPKHSGGFAVALAIPTVGVVLMIVGFAAPHLTTTHLETMHKPLGEAWVAFVSSILALSGVEAIANLTGVMKLDPGSTPDKPKVSRESFLAILPVAIEVTVGTALLGWAMLSVPRELDHVLDARHEDILKYLSEYYVGLSLGHGAGLLAGALTGIIVGMLLLSAVNTAIAAMIGLIYTLSRDGEMPRNFVNTNRNGVPMMPLALAVILPSGVLLLTIPNPQDALKQLGDLYAIGVVGAITLNLFSCATNRKLDLNIWERTLFFGTFVVLAAVEITLAKTKPDALLFVVGILGGGLSLRAWSHHRSGLATVTVPKEMAIAIAPETLAAFKPVCTSGGCRIMVAARGMTPVLRFAMQEARLRQAELLVLYVQEIAVLLGVNNSSGSSRPRWQDDPNASTIMSLMLKAGEENGVNVLPVYAVSTNAAGTIVDLAATMGVDFLMLGATHRGAMANLLRGDVVSKVAAGLPENIELIIHG